MLRRFFEELVFAPLGGCFHINCPRCKHRNSIPKGDLVCWVSYEQYAESHKESCGEYPRCVKCGAELKP